VGRAQQVGKACGCEGLNMEAAPVVMGCGCECQLSCPVKPKHLVSLRQGQVERGDCPAEVRTSGAAAKVVVFAKVQKQQLQLWLSCSCCVKSWPKLLAHWQSGICLCPGNMLEHALIQAVSRSEPLNHSMHL